MLDLIDDTVWNVARRHENFDVTLKALRDQAVGRPVDSFVQTAYQLAAGTRFEMLAVAEPVFAKLAPNVDTLELRVACEAALGLAIQRDLTATVNGMRRDALAYSRLSGRVGHFSAVAGIASQVSRSSFVQLDALGRQPNSVAYVRVAVRQALVGAYALSYAMTLIDTDATQFTAVHPEEGRVTLPVEDFDNWAAEQLHPNTRWSLG